MFGFINFDNIFDFLGNSENTKVVLCLKHCSFRLLYNSKLVYSYHIHDLNQFLQVKLG